MACMTAQIVLHDEAGIADCCALVAEMDKCKAGGLPPPVRVPTEAERRAEEERTRQEAEARQRAMAEAQAAEAELQRLAAEQTADACMADEADLLALSASPVAPQAAAAGLPPRLSPEDAARAEVAQTMTRVHFCNTVDAMVAALDRGDAGRACMLLEAPTTSVGGFAPLVDVAVKVLQHLVTKAGEPNSSKFRCVVLVNRCHDLIFKAIEKFKNGLPTWEYVTVQVQTKERQAATGKLRPGYAVVFAPPNELSQTELTVLQVPRLAGAASKYCLHMRCTEAECLWRPVGSRAGAGAEAAADQGYEIDVEDKYDLLAQMMDAEAEEPVGASAEDCDLVSQEIPKRDAIVDLWPYSNPPDFYKEVFVSLAAGDKAKTCIILSTTAHPGHWLASIGVGMEAVVLTRRWSEHSAGHGVAIGKQLLHKEALARQASLQPPEPTPRATPINLISACVRQGSLLAVEAYDVCQGSEWYDGLNMAIPTSVLVAGCQANVRKDWVCHRSSWTRRGGVGRGKTGSESGGRHCRKVFTAAAVRTTAWIAL